MAKKYYIGVADKARKGKKLYLGVGGKARKVKKVYVGVNGIARLSYVSAFEYTFSGSSVFTGSADGDWSLVLKSNGNLNITSMPTNVDIFAVGGGGTG